MACAGLKRRTELNPIQYPRLRRQSILGKKSRRDSIKPSLSHDFCMSIDADDDDRNTGIHAPILPTKDVYTATALPASMSPRLDLDQAEDGQVSIYHT